MRADPGTLAAVGGAGALTGILVARCLLNRDPAQDAEEDALLEEAFFSSKAPSASAVRRANSDAVNKVIAEMLENPAAFEIPQQRAPPPSRAAAPPTPTVDQVKGCISTESDGSRWFDRPDVGLKFRVGPEWLGTEEMSETQPTGRMWMARFGDPQTIGSIGGRQLVFICEQVPEGLTASEYAQKSRQAQESMQGQFSHVNFVRDEPCSVGAFDRQMMYTQAIPFMPGTGMPGPLDVTVMNYLCVRRGVAYTVQYMAPSTQYRDHVDSLEGLVRSVEMASVEPHRGVFTREKDHAKVVLPTGLGFSLAPAGAEVPPALLRPVRLEGALVDTYANANNVFISILYDEAEGEAGRSLFKQVNDDFPAALSGSLNIIREMDSAEEVIEYTCCSDEHAVAAAMVRVPGTDGRLRAAAWLAIPEKQDLHQTWMAHPDRGAVRASLLKVAACFSYTASPVAPPKTSYRNKATGLAFNNIDEGSEIKDGFIGELCLAYSPNAASGEPVDLQVLRTEPKPTLSQWVDEMKGDLSRAGGVIGEETEGWLGREQMHQIVAKLPGPPMDGNYNGPPTVMTLFITMVSTEHASWSLQWRSLGDLDRMRDMMESTVENIRFTAPQA